MANFKELSALQVPFKKADLITELPEFLQEFYEFQEWFKTVDYEIDLKNQALNQLWANQFILTADAPTIEKWENLLNIHPTTGESLIDRKKMILVWMNTKAPLTYPWLEGLFNQLFGSDYFMEMDYNNYTLIVDVYNLDLDNKKDLFKFLRKIIPANILIIEPYHGTFRFSNTEDISEFTDTGFSDDSGTINGTLSGGIA